MDIKVVMGEAKPCPDLARRLAMVYDLLLRRTEEAGTGQRIENQAPTGEEVGVTSVEAGKEPDLIIQ